jgi:hypothetical protein
VKVWGDERGSEVLGFEDEKRSDLFGRMDRVKALARM